MTSFVLDASALLALLLGEAGADKVKAALDSSCRRALNAPQIGALNIPRFRDVAALAEPGPGRP